MNIFTGKTITGEMTGSEAVIRVLRAYGITEVMKAGDGAASLFCAPLNHLGVNFNSFADAQSALFAADAFAIASREVSVAHIDVYDDDVDVFATLENIRDKGAPIVILTNEPSNAKLKSLSGQEKMRRTLLKNAVKDYVQIRDVAEISSVLRRAILLANSGQPGPILVEIGQTCAQAYHSFSSDELNVDKTLRAVPSMRSRPCDLAIKKAAVLLSVARRPILLCGGGVHGSVAADEVALFATLFNIPVAHSRSGKGGVSCTSKLNAGLFGETDRIANSLIEDADCILIAGCSGPELMMGDALRATKQKSIIHLDSCAENIGYLIDPTIKLWGDIRMGLEDLRALMLSLNRHQDENRAGYINEVMMKMTKWRTKNLQHLHSPSTPVHIARVITELNKSVEAEGYVVADSGLASDWGALLFDIAQAGQFYLPDMGDGSTGYALSGALGVGLAKPESRVVALMDAANASQNIENLKIAISRDIPIICVVMHRSGETVSDQLTSVSGCCTHTVDRPEDLSDLLYAACQGTGQPTLINVQICERSIDADETLGSGTFTPSQSGWVA